MTPKTTVAIVASEFYIDEPGYSGLRIYKSRLSMDELISIYDPFGEYTDYAPSEWPEPADIAGFRG